MTDESLARFQEFRLYALEIARRFARRFPAWREEYESAALQALAEAAQRWRPDTRGPRTGRVCSFKTFATVQLRRRLGQVTRFISAKKRTPPGVQVRLDIQLDRAALRSAPDSPSPSAGLLELLALLPEREREAVRLYYQEHHTYAEVGRHLGISRQRARDLIARALATLRTRLGRPDTN